MIEIRYHKSVLLFFDDLFDVLIEKGYFSFYETSAQYIEELVAFIEQNIHTLQSRTAPPYFSKYGRNMLYISYNRNRQTTWYIFYEKYDQYYYVRHITNNHVEGQYFT